MRASKSGAVLATPVTVLPLVSILRALVASGEYGVESVAGQFDRQGAVPRRASSRTTGVHMNDVAPAPEISTNVGVPRAAFMCHSQFSLSTGS
jgi:hypothetical protein